MRLDLLDEKCASGPVDRIDLQPCDLTGSKPVVRHEMQDHEIPPARLVRSFDGAQKLLDDPPLQGAWWPLIPKTDRLIQGVKSSRDPATLETIRHEGTQMAHRCAQRCP